MVEFYKGRAFMEGVLHDILLKKAHELILLGILEIPSVVCHDEQQGFLCVLVAEDAHPISNDESGPVVAKDQSG